MIIKKIKNLRTKILLKKKFEVDFEVLSSNINFGPKTLSVSVHDKLSVLIPVGRGSVNALEQSLIVARSIGYGSL